MGPIELMTLDDMINAISLSGILFYFLSPTIVILLAAYIIRRRSDKRKAKREKRKKQRELIEQGRKIIDIDVRAIKQLETVEAQPKQENMQKFKSLTLEFDETGHVK